MNRKFRFLVIFMMLLASFLFTGCDSGSSDPISPSVPVAGVSLDKNTLLLKTGTYGTLTATVLPENATNKSVTWSSDKPDIAKVDRNGKVTGVAEGTATIIAITADGVKTAVCVVTVADEFYTVKFDVQGHGTAPENQYAAKDSKIFEPTDPTADGVNFKGWYKEAACTNRWKFNANTVTADNTILYAKWVKVYTVSFNANGGIGTMSDVPVEDRTSYESPANEFIAPKIPVGAVNEGADIPFKCWKDGSGTEYAAGTLIPVSTDITLTAQWAKPSFSVSTDKKVYFAKGNLYWDGSSFKIYEKQTDLEDTWNESKVDKFYWSKTASVAYVQSYVDGSANENDVFFTNDPTDAEKAKTDFTVNGVTGKYRTLSKGEWVYLFITRTDAADKVGYGTVCGMNGIILLPDVFTDPMKNNGTGAFVPKATIGWNANIYSDDGWAEMEAAGAVFLPAAGYRAGSNVNDVGSLGYYWSATPLGLSSNGAYDLYFDVGNVNPADYSSRFYGQSVRLVCDVGEN